MIRRLSTLSNLLRQHPDEQRILRKLSMSYNIPQEIKDALPELVSLAQKEYDAWQVNEHGYDSEVGSGGICHLIADSFANHLGKGGRLCTTVSSDHEVHVYVVLRLPSGVWLVDIRPYHYETGGGYSWKKIPDVKFDEEHITIDCLSSNPKEFRNYTDIEEWELEENEEQTEEDN
jgi:hypothetical protein